MGLLNGSIGMRRYLVTDGSLTEPFALTREAVERQAFEGFRAEDDERELIAGWVPFADETDFCNFVQSPEGAFLRLRVDTRKVPSYLLREVAGEMAKEWKLKAGREDLTRAERDEIRGICFRRLLARALPQTKIVDVVIVPSAEEVWFLNTADRVNGLFRALFEKTFGVKLRHLSPAVSALRGFPWETDGPRWSEIFGGGEPAAILNHLPERGWPEDFLTWLWYRTEESGGDLALEGGSPVVLWVEDRLRLVGLDGESHDVTLKTGDVGKSPEAASALAGKKQVAEARFGLIREDREYFFLIKAETFDLCGLKAPKAMTAAENEDGWAAAALVRTGGVREVAEVMDGLYAEYLGLRLSGAWERETYPDLQRWAAAKVQAEV